MQRITTPPCPASPPTSPCASTSFPADLLNLQLLKPSVSFRAFLAWAGQDCPALALSRKTCSPFREDQKDQVSQLCGSMKRKQSSGPSNLNTCQKNLTFDESLFNANYRPSHAHQPSALVLSLAPPVSFFGWATEAHCQTAGGQLDIGAAAEARVNLKHIRSQVEEFPATARRLLRVKSCTCPQTGTLPIFTNQPMISTPA